VGLEDRQDLLGHKSGRMTTRYSAAEIGNLLVAVNPLGNSRGFNAGTVLQIGSGCTISSHRTAIHEHRTPPR
jgi:hypothetical protein